MRAGLLVGAFLLSAVTAVSHHRHHDLSSPVTRIVELLEDLATKVEKDGRAETKLYKKFQCWCTDVEKKKTKSIAAAEARITELNTAIDDLVNGRTTLTSEQADLQKQLAALQAEVATMTENRNKQKAEYDQSKTEFEQAIAALNKAIKVLGDATSPSLISLQGSSRALKDQMLIAKFDLRKVLAVGRDMFSEDQVQEVENFLDRQDPKLDVPVPDYRKLNKNSPAFEKYKAGSVKIQKTMASMLETFTKNLADTNAQEAQNASDFAAFSDAKAQEKAALEAALQAQSLEKASRAKSIAAYKAERSTLQTQLEADKKLLADSQFMCSTRASEYEERLKLRTEEAESIRKAIGILHSDDARDLFRTSFKSQGVTLTETANSLLQIQTNSRTLRYDAHVRRKLAGLLQRAAHMAHSKVLEKIALDVKYANDPNEHANDNAHHDDKDKKDDHGDKTESHGDDHSDSHGDDHGHGDEHSTGAAKPTEEAKHIDPPTDAPTSAPVAHADAPAAASTEDAGLAVFATVRDIIRERIQGLKDEEKREVEKKQWCKDETFKTEQSSKKLGQDIDDLTEQISRISGRRGEIEERISAVLKEVQEIQKSQEKQQKYTAEEHAQYLKDRKDDEDAAALLDQAVAVLNEFYTKNKLESVAPALMSLKTQTRLSLLKRHVASDNAPKDDPNEEHIEGHVDIKPAPVLWNGRYQGSSGETGGVVAVLTLVKEDVIADIEAAEAEDKQAAANLAKFIADSNSDIADRQSEKTELEQENADLLQKLGDSGVDRQAAQEQLEGAVKYLKGIQPGCNFLLSRFDERFKQRDTERVGLEKALAALSGADFEKYWKDPSREFAPGDAF